MEDEVVDFFVEHSPPNSAPIYLFLAENWDIVHQGLVAFLALVFVISVTVAASLYLEISE